MESALLRKGRERSAHTRQEDRIAVDGDDRGIMLDRRRRAMGMLHHLLPSQDSIIHLKKWAESEDTEGFPSSCTEIKQQN